MKKLTVKKILSLGPSNSYSYEMLEKFSLEGKLSLLDIAMLPIPEEDRVWILLSPFVVGPITFYKVIKKIAQRSSECYDFVLKIFRAFTDPWDATKWVAMAAAEPTENMRDAVMRERKLQLLDIVEELNL